MQTIAVQIQDNYMPQFINYIQEHSSDLSISKDKNLEQDPYFYDRQKKLHQIRDNIKNGKTEMISDKDFWNEIDSFVESL